MDNSGITSALFKNTTQLYDGNLYGIVLNEKGVVVNGFILNRDDAVGNIGIHLQDITISNLVSQPVEIIGLSTPNPTCTECVAYGTTSQAGPIGDILQIENITDTSDINKYKSTVLANAQLIIAKYNTPKKGTTSITLETTQWVKDPSNLVVPFFGVLYLAMISWALAKTVDLYLLISLVSVIFSICRISPMGPACDVVPYATHSVHVGLGVLKPIISTGWETKLEIVISWRCIPILPTASSRLRINPFTTTPFSFNTIP